jgi:hypothetical protein
VIRAAMSDGGDALGSASAEPFYPVLIRNAARRRKTGDGWLAFAQDVNAGAQLVHFNI